MADKYLSLHTMLDLKAPLTMLILLMAPFKEVPIETFCRSQKLTLKTMAGSFQMLILVIGRFSPAQTRPLSRLRVPGTPSVQWIMVMHAIWINFLLSSITPQRIPEILFVTGSSYVVGH